MLDDRIESGELRVCEVRQLGEHLARFHAAAPAAALSPEQYRAALAYDVERRCGRLAEAGDAVLPRAVVVALCSELHGFLADEHEAFDQRVAAGRVVIGHGDLRPWHVCLLPVPVVVGCPAEGTLRRAVDTLDELACLAMECERLGAEWVGPEILAAHLQVCADAPVPSVVGFYKALRAVESAALALGDGPAEEVSPREVALARLYGGLAARHAATLR
jgi:aminoglycoside phosphotransferase family enzyme